MRIQGQPRRAIALDGILRPHPGALVLRGEVCGHHRYLLQELLDDLERIGAGIGRIEDEVIQRTAPYERQLDRLNTISGVDWVTAWTLPAELGDDMSAFSDAHHAASWA